MVSISFSKISDADILYQLTHYNENKGHIIIIITTVFFAFTLISVVLRFATKRLKRIHYRVEDFLIVIALFSSLALWIEALLCAKLGVGKHSLRVFSEHGLEYLISVLKVLFGLMITYNSAHLFLKLSILFYYRSIFTFIMNWFTWAWYFVFTYTILNFIVSLILVFTQCQPYSHIWEEPRGLPGHCGNLSAIDISAGILTAVADLMLLVLPMPVLWSLQRPVKEKLMLCALFALSSITIAASIIRINYMSEVDTGVDFTYIAMNTLIWSVIEIDLGIICACIPTIKPLFNRRSKQKNTSGTSYIRSHSTGQPRTKASTGSSDEYPLTQLGDDQT